MLGKGQCASATLWCSSFTSRRRLARFVCATAIWSGDDDGLAMVAWAARSARAREVSTKVTNPLRSLQVESFSWLIEVAKKAMVMQIATARVTTEVRTSATIVVPD